MNNENNTNAANHADVVRNTNNNTANVKESSVIKDVEKDTVGNISNQVAVKMCNNNVANVIDSVMGNNTIKDIKNTKKAKVNTDGVVNSVKETAGGVSSGGDVNTANGFTDTRNHYQQQRDYHVTDIDDTRAYPSHHNSGDHYFTSMAARSRAHSMTLAPAKSLILTTPDENDSHPPTSYFQSIVHLFKGNIGPGLFAMGDAFKNGGLIVAPLLTIAIALISIHCQHILINCSNRMRIVNKLDFNADYADTVQQVFENGPIKLQSWSRKMRVIVNVFICVTQLGFCCIYFVFISTNAKQILDNYGIHIDVHWIMVIAFVPILLSSLITNLKWLTPISLIANLCMIFGLAITLYYALCSGLPDISQRNLYTNPPKLALFFGTAIFAFEGIALVLPLKNAMKRPDNFERPLGVLNVGMFFVSSLFIFAGSIGYMKWGEGVGGSLTFNLGDSVLAQCVKAMVSMGVLFGYPLQFFIAIQIIWPDVKERLGIQKRSIIGELVFRTIMVLMTLGIAELVPALSLFISLIGSLCSTALALVFPPMIELLIRTDDDKKGPSPSLYVKNICIILLALLGFSTGTYESLSQIVRHFGETDIN